MILRLVAILAATAPLSLALVAPAAAQEEPPPKGLVVRPAKEPIPALHYRLLPEASDLIPGNAAIFYHRAIEGLIRRNLQLQLQALQKRPAASLSPSDDQVADWLAGPIDEIPRDQLRRILDTYRSVLKEIEQGARRETCDWEFRRRDEGFSLDLDEIQQARWLARLVVLQVRLDIAEGRFDSALRWIRTGLTLARHVGESQFYLQSLVAAAIVEDVAKSIEIVIQAAECPNLYWALAALPRPFIDLTSAGDGERRMLEREFPRLRDIEETVWSIEQARAFGAELEDKGGLLLGRWTFPKSTLTAPTVADLAQHLTVAGLVAGAYPEAKRALVATGMSPERVEAMPAIQVVALYSYRIYEKRRDDIFKWSYLPPSQGAMGLAAAETAAARGPQVGIPFVNVLPGIRFVFNVPMRIDRRFAALQAVEAVRMYASTHDGSPPPNLEALAESPMPLDPATGTPFRYSVDGATATLVAPPPVGLDQGRQLAVHYRIQVAH